MPSIDEPLQEEEEDDWEYEEEEEDEDDEDDEMLPRALPVQGDPTFDEVWLTAILYSCRALCNIAWQRNIGSTSMALGTTHARGLGTSSEVPFQVHAIS